MIEYASRIVGDGGAMLLSGGQAVESAKQVYTNITNGEGLTWKNAVDVITLGISVAGMGMAGASIAKSGKSLKAMYKGETAVSNVATSNATKGVSQARENAGQMKMDLQLFGGKSSSGTINNVGKTSPFDLQATHSQTLSKKNMNKLIENIKNNGINETIKYVEHNNQKYIVDGHHRVIVAKRLGIKEVPIEEVQLPYAGYKTIEDLMWVD